MWVRENALSTLDISKMKLNILARRGKTDEFLKLASATGNHLRYTLKLVELERIDEAIAYAEKHLERAGEIHSLAKNLYEKDYEQQAISMAEAGLSMPGDKYLLGKWVKDVAGDNPSLALKSSLESFRSMPTFEGYQEIAELAGKGWNKIKPEVMQILNKRGLSDIIVEVLLSENQIAKAIEIAEKERCNYELLARVADAAMKSHPDWVIRIAARQAEELIERRKGKGYSAAVFWLSKMKSACIISKKQKKWKTHLECLKTEHKRKYSLMDKLKSLE